jgi:hypothetical protein
MNLFFILYIPVDDWLKVLSLFYGFGETSQAGLSRLLKEQIDYYYTDMTQNHQMF